MAWGQSAPPHSPEHPPTSLLELESPQPSVESSTSMLPNSAPQHIVSVLLLASILTTLGATISATMRGLACKGCRHVFRVRGGTVPHLPMPVNPVSPRDEQPLGLSDPGDHRDARWRFTEYTGEVHSE
jgi:hypothetical protein